MIAVALSFSAGSAAMACGPDAIVQFSEGAPVDRFRITNESQGNWQLTALTLDLKPSAGRLIFDTERGGTGIDVYQPFVSLKGDVVLSSVEGAVDGSEQISMEFQNFEPEKSYTFTIDVDDRLTISPFGQIRVMESEIAGADVMAVFVDSEGNEAQATGTFLTDSSARISQGACT